QFLLANGVEEWPDGTLAGRYTFRHALYQQVVYARVPAARRRGLHQRIGERTEAGYGGQARERAAHREAVAGFEEALEALQHLPESPDVRQQAFDLRMKLGVWLAQLADYERIAIILREAEAIADGLGDRRRIGLVWASMIDCFRITGDNEQAIACG